MIADLSDICLDLSQIVYVELKTTIRSENEVDKVMISIRPEPKYVYRPDIEKWMLVNEPIIIERNFSNSYSASQFYVNLMDLWSEYVNKEKRNSKEISS